MFLFAPPPNFLLKSASPESHCMDSRSHGQAAFDYFTCREREGRQEREKERGRRVERGNEKKQRKRKMNEKFSTGLLKASK